MATNRWGADVNPAPNHSKFHWTTERVITLCVALVALTAYGATKFQFASASPVAPAQSVAVTPQVTRENITTKPEVEPQYYRVTKVLGGDLLQLDGNIEVSLIGVNCPSNDDPDPQQSAFAYE